jgi:hypothetical protein
MENAKESSQPNEGDPKPVTPGPDQSSPKPERPIPPDDRIEKGNKDLPERIEKR